MAVPEFESFFLPTLKFFKDNKIHTKKDLAEKNADYFNLTEEDKGIKTKKNNAYQYKDRTNWAVNYLFKAQLLKREKKGKFQITEEGLKVLEKGLYFIDENFLLQYESFREYRKTEKPEIDEAYYRNKMSEKIEKIEESLSPTERLEEAYGEINKELSEELFSMIKNTTPRFFEKLVVELLLKMGYGFAEDSGQVTQYTKDGGIDGIIFEDELGLSQIHIQAKQHSNPVNQDHMKNFAYTLEHGVPKGVIITTSTFTSGAIKISEESDAQIVLINGEKLTELMIKHDVGVFTEYNFPIKKIDSDFFEED